MLSTVFEKDSIESYFSNPFVAKGDKLAALQSVAGEAGLSETTLNLFGVMAENNRMNLVSEVAEVYARIIQADAGTRSICSNLNLSQPRVDGRYDCQHW